MIIQLSVLLIAVILTSEVTSDSWDGCDDTKAYSEWMCPRHFMPFCGSDSKTYSNDCVFCKKKAQLRSRGLQLNLAHKGFCSSRSQRPSTRVPAIYRPTTTRAPFTFRPVTRRPIWYRPTTRRPYWYRPTTRRPQDLRKLREFFLNFYRSWWSNRVVKNRARSGRRFH